MHFHFVELKVYKSIKAKIILIKNKKVVLFTGEDRNYNE